MDVRKRFFTQRVVEHWKHFQAHQRSDPMAARDAGEFGHHFQAQGVTLGPCTGPRVGLNDPDGSLPT